MWLLDFLFGKKPEIQFNSQGKATHNFPPEKWEQWNNRFQKSSSYDWRQHAGKKLGGPKKNSAR